MAVTLAQGGQVPQSVLIESQWEDEYRAAYARESASQVIAVAGQGEFIQEADSLRRAVQWTVAIGLAGLAVAAALASAQWWIGQQ